MTPWLLLLGTLVCAYLTYDAFRLGSVLKDAPFSAISSMWKGDLSHLPQVDKNKIKSLYVNSIHGIFQIKFLFLLATLGMAVATIRAFIA